MERKDIFKTYREKLPDKDFIKFLKFVKASPYYTSVYAKSFLKLFDRLGYDLTSQYIYTVVNRDSYQWLHTTGKNKLYSKKIWNVKQKCYEYIDRPYDLNEHILKHIFPFELKNNTLNKTLRNNNTDNKRAAHYIEYDMCGCKLKEQSDILILDIDCHNGNTLKTYNTFTYLLQNKEILDNVIFVEKSYEGSYHVFIKLNHSYSLEEKKQYIKDILKDTTYEIEIPTYMRFPFSYHYETKSAMDELSCNFESNSITPTNSRLNILSQFRLYPNKGLKLSDNIIIKKDPQIISKIYSRDKKSNIKHITPEEFLKDTNISISAYNRHHSMLEICRIAKFNNWSIQETLQIIRQLDQGSRDLKKWNDTKLFSVIENIFEKSTIKYIEHIESRPIDFISNTKHIPQQVYNTITNESFLKQIIKNCNYKQTELNIKKFKIVLSEMIGAIYYDSINNRVTKNNKPNKYLIGKQFSEYFALQMKKYYSIEIPTFDCYTIMHSILNNSQLFKQYKINTRGWYFNHLDKSLNYCKQFDLTNNKNHYLFNNNNVISIIIINLLTEFFNKFNIIKLLYILDFFYKTLIKNNQSLLEIDYFYSDNYCETG